MKFSENFKRSEFACKCGCGFDTVDAELIFVLIIMRKHFKGRAVTINSGSRCKTHNHNEGGSTNSKHLIGRAADIAVQGVHTDKVADYLELTYPGTYGIGRYDGRTHIDTRAKKARWDCRAKKPQS